MPAILNRNDALNVNPPTGTSDALTTNGSDWLYAVTAIYFAATFAVVGLSYFARAGEKIFHYLFTISLLTGSIAYFTMASDLGWLAITVADTLSSPGAREIFYARYINWFVGWTPLVIAISLLSTVSWATVVYNIALTWTIAATWLISAVITDNYKWAYYAFGLFATVLLFLSLWNPGLSTAKRAGVSLHYNAIVGYLGLLFVLYAIAHGLDDGNRIGVTEDFIFIGIIDVLSTPVLAFVFLFLSRRWDYRELHLQFTQYGRVERGGWSPEKEAPVTNQPAEATAAGTATGSAADTAAGTAPANKETV